MNAVTVFLLLAIALIVIVALAAYAMKLRREVKKREQFRLDEDRRAQTNSLENLDLVVSALIQEQVEITEGAWRCKVLLEIIDPSLTERADFRPFAEVYQRTQHLKTHSARKTLTPRERMQEDRERLEVEDQWRNEVLKAAEAVRQWRLQGAKALH